MKLWSDSFGDGQAIPARFAFGKPDAKIQVTLSDNINPHLAWNGLPPGTRSLALLCHDYDVPSKGDDVNQPDRVVPADLPRVDFFHWVLVDLAPSIESIGEGAFSSGVAPKGKAGPGAPLGARQGINDYTNWFSADADMRGDYFGYDGPCPPWNDTLLHHYVFTLYALDIAQVPVDGTFTGADVRAAIEGHVLAQAAWSGTYTLNPSVG